MTILKVKTRNSWAGPGMDAFDAEAKIWDDAGKTLYVHCTLFCGEFFSVAEKSSMSYMTDTAVDDDDESFDKDEEICLLEDYSSLNDALQSDYIDIFLYLRKVLDGMMDITYGHKESVFRDVVGEVTDEIEKNFNSADDFDVYSSYSFEYQSKAMPNVETRKLVVGITQDSYYFRLFGVDDELIEEFDYISQASRSKWAVLYERAWNEAAQCLKGILFHYEGMNKITSEERKRIEASLGD